MRFGPCVAVVFLALVSVAAKADTSNPVSGTGGGFSGSGTLSATSNGDGSYTITGISGPGVTGLLGPGQFHGNDNLLFPSATTALDANGFAFTDTQGDTSYDVDLAYSSSLGGYEAYTLDSDGMETDVLGTFSLTNSETTNAIAAAVAQAGTTAVFRYSFVGQSVVAPTPEPSSVALLGTGVLGLAGVVRRRMRV
jgi:hypothetical protein